MNKKTEITKVLEIGTITKQMMPARSQLSKWSLKNNKRVIMFSSKFTRIYPPLKTKKLEL